MAPVAMAAGVAWLGGVLRKVAGERARAVRQSGGMVHHLHPAVHHMLLVSAATPTRWFASHPPLAERIRRICGRPMPVLHPQHGKAVTRPDALF